MHKLQRAISRATAIVFIGCGAIACGSGVGAPAPTTNADDGATTSRTFSTTAGVCVATTTHTRTWGAAECGAREYGGRAIAAGVRLLGGVGDIVLTDTGELHDHGGTETETLVDLDVPGVLSAEVANVETAGAHGRSRAGAEITQLHLGLAGIDITADVLTSRARGRCTPEGASYSGDTTIANLYVDGVRIDVDATPNRVIEIRGILRIVLNEQHRDGDGFTVAALHVSVLSVLSAADIVIARATTSLTCDECSAPGDDDDESDDDDDVPPPPPPPGGDDDDGDDDCEDEAPSPPPGGGAGDPCDAEQPCAPGFACARDRAPVVR